MLKKEGITNLAVFEVLAIREALSWIKDKGKTCFIVESNFLGVVQRVNAKKHGQSPFEEVARD